MVFHVVSLPVSESVDLKVASPFPQTRIKADLQTGRITDYLGCFLCTLLVARVEQEIPPIAVCALHPFCHKPRLFLASVSQSIIDIRIVLY